MTRWVCAAQRFAAVLVWLPVLLLGPVVDLLGGADRPVLGWLLVAAMAAATLTTAYAAVPPRRHLTAYAALAVLAGAVLTGTALGADGLATWILLAITVPVALCGWWVAAGLVATVLASVAAAASTDPTGGAWGAGFVVALAGINTAVVLTLIETNRELRRTRAELARTAVVEERERFSRDLHDLLGHTLSVMVVKAEAVRRLAHRDPDAVVTHAVDIETVGRDALTQVRQAVDGLARPCLADELTAAQRALAAAGIVTELAVATAASEAAGDTLAWVVREGATNVLRHSGAGRCRIELRADADRWELRIVDDGAGRTVGPAAAGRRGGLDGLSSRLVAAGGALEVEPGPPGFSLTARVPR